MHYLYLATIYPIELLIEFFYVLFFKAFLQNGVAIIGISIAINLLTLPLYHMAETFQKKEREQREYLAKGIKRIKSSFKGDEQFFILSTYYRQNNYHPIYTLRGSLTLLIQIPFFIAAFKFLSNLAVLNGDSFLFIKNLGKADNLLRINEFSVNLLPILMTIINVISGMIYTKGFMKRDKVQLYLMALLFLILLYNSPSGLVLYWTINNILSLLKNILSKLKRPILIAYLILLISTILATLVIFRLHPHLAKPKRIFVISINGFIFSLPILIIILRFIFRFFSTKTDTSLVNSNKIFVLAALLLSILQGFLLPANLISSSTIEFAFTGIINNPTLYILKNSFIFLGIWLIWGSFIYFSSSSNSRPNITTLFVSISLSAIINAYIFKGDYGIVSNSLDFNDARLLQASFAMKTIPILIFVLIFFICFLIFTKKKAIIIESILIILIASTIISGAYQIISINTEYKKHIQTAYQNEGISKNTQELSPIFKISKNGENIIYIFLDMASGSFFPYILEDLPNLSAQLDGFVYYPNTISFGSNTILGSPAMLGGYEYTPDEINKRVDKKLVDKHNEALLVMPTMLLNEGFNITLTDPIFSNYGDGADHTPFIPYPKMNVIHLGNKLAAKYKEEHKDVLENDISFFSNYITKRMPLFVMLKTSFPMLRKFIYEDSRYLQIENNKQLTDSFINSYSQLYYLSYLTELEESGDNFISISNQTPHMPIILQTPDFAPYSLPTSTISFIDSKKGIRPIDRSHYHANVAALDRVGQWLDYLKEHDVYNNSKIIIVSDHSNLLYSEKMESFGPNKYRYNSYVPLLLFKDFNATEPLSTDNTFMTNADASLFALKDLKNNPINPFTNKNIFEQINKTIVNVYTGLSNPKDYKENYYEFFENESFSIKDDIFIESNWTPIKQNSEADK